MACFLYFSLCRVFEHAASVWADGMCVVLQGQSQTRQVIMVFVRLQCLRKIMFFVSDVGVPLAVEWSQKLELCFILSAIRLVPLGLAVAFLFLLKIWRRIYLVLGDGVNTVDFMVAHASHMYTNQRPIHKHTVNSNCTMNYTLGYKYN